jgi:hypothetical protein
MLERCGSSGCDMSAALLVDRAVDHVPPRGAFPDSVV